MNQTETYIIVDIEAAGPAPPAYALLAIGACTLEDPPQSFYIELQPDSERRHQEAMQVHQLSLEDLAKNGIPPLEAMAAFAAWVEAVTPQGSTPIFTAFNAPFDWMFVNVYFHRYLGYNPFGHKALDIKAYYMGAKKVPFLETSHRHISARYPLTSQLSHHALEDAGQEAALFKRLLHERSA